MQFLSYFYFSVYLHFLNAGLVEANLNNSTALMSVFLRPTSHLHEKSIRQKCQVPDLLLSGLGDRITSDGQVQAYTQQVSHIPDQNKEG